MCNKRNKNKCKQCKCKLSSSKKWTALSDSDIPVMSKNELKDLGSILTPVEQPEPEVPENNISADYYFDSLFFVKCSRYALLVSLVVALIFNFVLDII